MVHNSALKVVKITTLFESTQEKCAFSAIFFQEKNALKDYIFDFQSFVKTSFKQYFFRFNRVFSVTARLFPQHLINIGLWLEERVRSLPAAHTLGTALVTPHHTLGLPCLTLKVRVFGSIILSFRLFFIPFHLSLGFTHGPRLLRRGTGAKKQSKHQQDGNNLHGALHNR